MENEDVICTNTNNDDDNGKMQAREISHLEKVCVNANCYGNAHEYIYQTGYGQEKTSGMNCHVDETRQNYEGYVIDVLVNISNGLALL